MKVFLNVVFISFVCSVSCDTHSKCYGSLGCITVDTRLPLPQEPTVINGFTSVYDRQHLTTPSVTISARSFQQSVNTFASNLDMAKQTKIIVHGFNDKSTSKWISNMTAALLKKGDFNVLVVDWSHGNGPNYYQSVTNTYIVAAQLAYLLNNLHQTHGLQFNSVHIIGHSLGAQIAGHIGQRVNKIGRITGLDPADPGFTSNDMDTRLDSTDATYVDIIHTDASSFKLVSGFGSRDAVGHTDFYPNGGEHQPGCEKNIITASLSHLFHGSLQGIVNTLSCSHGRAPRYFTESINSNCTFKSHKCASYNDFEAGKCMNCPSGGCPSMGYDADKTTSARGSFFLSTSSHEPFCGYEYLVEVKDSHIMNKTYGELYLTLNGQKGDSEELLFSRSKEYYIHDQDEKRVLATHKDIGTVSSVKVRFDREPTTYITLVDEIKLFTIIVTPIDVSGRSTKICSLNTIIHDQQTITFGTHTGC